MSTVADKLAKKSSHKTSAKQVRLRLVYVDFWSAVKLSFLAAIAVAIVTVVSYFLVFVVVQTTGLIARFDEFFQSFSENGVSITQFVGLPQVMAFAAVVAILNLIVITVLGAVVAGIYNLAVKITGGLLVGFTSN
jgi:mannose/fructose/N-acetylgalactosamine-specific phosphotransferase system component IIC